MRNFVMSALASAMFLGVASGAVAQTSAPTSAFPADIQAQISAAAQTCNNGDCRVQVQSLAAAAKRANVNVDAVLSAVVNAVQADGAFTSIANAANAAAAVAESATAREGFSQVAASATNEANGGAIGQTAAGDAVDAAGDDGDSGDRSTSLVGEPGIIAAIPASPN